MRIVGALLRILAGFVVACIIAGLTTAAFVITPSDIAGLPAELRPERLNNAGVLGLLAATHSAIFAFPFALLVIGYAEWRSVRSWLYYAVAGIVIGLVGFGAEYLVETGPQPSIVNDYAARAFLTVGFLGGIAYWLVSGRLAGRRRGGSDQTSDTESVESEPDEDDEGEPDPKLAAATR